MGDRKSCKPNLAKCLPGAFHNRTNWQLMLFDLVIKGGTVIDGSGAPAYSSDLGISGGKVIAIESLDNAQASTTIELAGEVVCPGFIDVHLHSEIALLYGPERDRYGALLQGVTTHLTAPDGFGWAPLPPDLAAELWENTKFAYGDADLPLNWQSAEAYLSSFSGRIPANIIPQVPHCAVRMAVMGWDARPATPDELVKMRQITREWLEAGAAALCLGLDYQPSAFADTRELVELCKVAREYGAIYAAHVRYSDLGYAGAWRETMEIGRQADIPVHISHAAITEETVPLIEEADKVCDLTFESYLYPAGCTHLSMMLPIWAQAGGPQGILKRMQDPIQRQLMRDHLQTELSLATEAGARAIFVANKTGRYLGLTIAEAAIASSLPIGDFAIKILEEEHPYALMVFHRAGSADLHRVTEARTIQHPRMMVASDGVYHGALVHPRGFGCFARILRQCRQQSDFVSLEQAIRKMSGFPAERFGIKNRGLLCKGYAADLVIFNRATVSDGATWESPRQKPKGIGWVLVNGQVVVRQGQPTGQLPGQVLRAQF